MTLEPPVGSGVAPPVQHASVVASRRAYATMRVISAAATTTEDAPIHLVGRTLLSPAVWRQDGARLAAIELKVEVLAEVLRGLHRVNSAARRSRRRRVSGGSPGSPDGAVERLTEELRRFVSMGAVAEARLRDCGALRSVAPAGDDTAGDGRDGEIASDCSDSVDGGVSKASAGSGGGGGGGRVMLGGISGVRAALGDALSFGAVLGRSALAKLDTAKRATVATLSRIARVVTIAPLRSAELHGYAQLVADVFTAAVEMETWQSSDGLRAVFAVEDADVTVALRAAEAFSRRAVLACVLCDARLLILRHLRKTRKSRHGGRTSLSLR